MPDRPGTIAEMLAGIVAVAGVTIREADPELARRVAARLGKMDIPADQDVFRSLVNMYFVSLSKPEVPPDPADRAN